MANKYPDNKNIQLRGVDGSDGTPSLLFNYGDANGWYASNWKKDKGRFGSNLEYEVQGYDLDTQTATVLDRTSARLYHIPLQNSVIKDAPQDRFPFTEITERLGFDNVHDNEVFKKWEKDSFNNVMRSIRTQSYVDEDGNITQTSGKERKTYDKLGSRTQADQEMLDNISSNYLRGGNAPSDFNESKLLKSAEEYKQLYDSGQINPGERYWAPTPDGRDLDMFQPPPIE